MQEIDVTSLNIDSINKIGKQWMLITAGDAASYNTMTASWGALGALWGRSEPAATIYIRPSRYTKQFVDNNEYFSLCFFSKDHKEALAYLGTHSGRDENKIEKVGFTGLFDQKAPYFKEAELVLICKKMYQQPLVESGFVDHAIYDQNYPDKSLHTMYIGRIEKALIKE